jgi:hypothetical protein
MRLLDRISFAAKAAPAEDAPRLGRHTEAGLVDRLRDELATMREERDEARRRSNYHLNLLRRSRAEVQHLQHLLGADAGVPGTEPVPAPIEPGCRDTPASNADTQAVDVSELRDAIGEGDTAVIPIVAIPPTMPVLPAAVDSLPPLTWGTKTGDQAALEAWATAPGALPGAGPSEISMTAGLAAVTKVHATLQPEGATP